MDDNPGSVQSSPVCETDSVSLSAREQIWTVAPKTFLLSLALKIFLLGAKRPLVGIGLNETPRKALSLSTTCNHFRTLHPCVNHQDEEEQALFVLLSATEATVSRKAAQCSGEWIDTGKVQWANRRKRRSFWYSFATSFALLTLIPTVGRRGELFLRKTGRDFDLSSKSNYLKELAPWALPRLFEQPPHLAFEYDRSYLQPH